MGWNFKETIIVHILYRYYVNWAVSVLRNMFRGVQFISPGAERVFFFVICFSAELRRGSITSHAFALTQRHVLTHYWSVPTGGEPCCRTAGFWLGPGLPAPGCLCSQPGQVHPKVSRWGLSAHGFYALPSSLFLSRQAGCLAICPFLNASYIFYITNLYKQETCLCMLYHISDSEPFL